MADLNFALLDLLFFFISIKLGDKYLNDFLKGNYNYQKVNQQLYVKLHLQVGISQ